MNEKTHIKVNVSVESIRNKLRRLLVSEHSALISDAIIGNLQNTPVGLEQLYKALSGYEEVFKYKVGDHILVRCDILSSWKYDKHKTEIAGIIRQNKVQALITRLNIHSDYPYTVAVTCIDSSDKRVSFDSVVNEEHMHTEEEWPEWPENPKVEEDNLPF